MSEAMSENTTTAQNGVEANDEQSGETCPHGSEWCASTADDELGCFDCFEAERSEESA